MATIARITEDAATILGILGEGETLPSYESNDMTNAYGEVYAQLQMLGLTTWSSTDDIPEQYSGPVAMLVADNRAVNYQLPQEKYVRVKQEGWGAHEDGFAVKRLRSLQVSSKLETTRIENF
jgi:hypothetical protein